MSNSNRSSGIGVCVVLFIVFLVLKLVGVIGWSWWWVFAPIWGFWAFVIVYAMIGATWIVFVRDRRNRRYGK